MDVDGGGTLDTLEVLEGMAKLGLKMDLSEVEELIAEVDDNGNGSLELSEFWQVVCNCLDIKHKPEPEPEEQKPPLRSASFGVSNTGARRPSGSAC